MVCSRLAVSDQDNSLLYYRTHSPAFSPALSCSSVHPPEESHDTASHFPLPAFASDLYHFQIVKVYVIYIFPLIKLTLLLLL